MKDVCELCSLCSPNMGCTKLSHESCLKEAIKLIKPSVTNGEMFKVIYPNMEVYKVDEDLDEIVVKLNSTSHYRWFPLSWWNRKWEE